MKLIISLDTADKLHARKIINACMNESNVIIKIGHIPLSAFGSDWLFKNCQNLGLFLDFKIKDIPNTVFVAINNYREISKNIRIITINGAAKIPMLAKAFAAGQQTIFSVLQLSSCEEKDPTNFLKLIDKNLKVGIKNFICPPIFLEITRKTYGHNIMLAVPGIRNEKTNDDHINSLTAKQAKSLAADYIIVGRPILNALNIHQTIKEYLL